MMNRSYDCEFYTARTREGLPRIRTFEWKPYRTNRFSLQTIVVVIIEKLMLLDFFLL